MENEAQKVFGNVVEGHGINPWIYSSIVFAISLVVFSFLWTLLSSRLRHLAKSSQSQWGEQLLLNASLPIRVLVVVFSFGIAGQSAPLIVRTHPLMIHGTHVAMIVLVIWIIERSIAVIFRSKALPETVNGSTRTLFLTMARAVLFSLGLLITLDTVGISITPILASLGVGSVAVALALQDTLSNFFGGLYLLIDKPIRVDDYVNINDIEGQVIRIGWRSTWILTASDNVVVVPNNKAATTHLKNYDLPSPSSSASLTCRVGMKENLERVEQVALAVAKEVVKIAPGADPSSVPGIYFGSFSYNGVEFSIGFRVKHYLDAGSVRHHLIKALQARFLAEGIEIPVTT